MAAGRKTVLSFAILAWSCSTQSPSASPSNPPEDKTAPPPQKVAPPPPSAEVAASKIEDDAYRTELLREFRLRNRSRPVDEKKFAAEGSSPIHEVHAFRRIGGRRTHVVLTVGFGRVARQEIDAENVFVELFAETRNYGPAIADVLSALGHMLHDPNTGRGFKPYASVKLEAPQHNLQFFDLVPSGEIDVGADHRVILLKVVPVTADEFEATKKGETQFAGRDDATPEGAERAYLRWAPALAQGAAEGP
jgi:hypothetical protein